jgi:large subunit ribosomal protein L35
MKKNKQKTRTGAARRFKITATGKVMRRAQNSRHLKKNKSKKAKRNYKVPVELKGKQAKKIKKMLGLA